MRVDPTRFVSNLQESRVSQSALKAKQMRLEALTLRVAVLLGSVPSLTTKLTVRVAMLGLSELLA